MAAVEWTSKRATVCSRSEKRETLLRAFARIQEYALERQRRVSSQLFKAAAELSEEEAQFTDFYSSSLRLPRELFQIEVLYNLGRAFHQVGSVICC